LKIVDLVEPDYGAEIPAPRFNGAPGQLHWVIRRHPETRENRLDLLWWGLALGEGRGWRSQTDQREGRDGRATAKLSRRLRQVPLHGAHRHTAFPMDHQDGRRFAASQVSTKATV
jgi:hypothetical protein